MQRISIAVYTMLVRSPHWITTPIAHIPKCEAAQEEVRKRREREGRKQTNGGKPGQEEENELAVSLFAGLYALGVAGFWQDRLRAQLLPLF